MVISKSMTEALKDLSRREGCALFMTLLAAFQALAARYTGQDDIVTDHRYANRNRSEVEGLIGYFINTLIFRTDLSGEPTFRDLLTRVREMSMAAFAHADLPYERLVEELKPVRDRSLQSGLSNDVYSPEPGETCFGYDGIKNAPV